MKNLIYVVYFLSYIAFLTSCSTCKEKEFFKKYAHVSGTKVHTATIGEALLTIAKNDLAECKSECEIIESDIKKYSMIAERYHNLLKEFNLIGPGCPCQPQGQCDWNIPALARYINDNTAFKVNDLHIEDINGNIISKIKNKIDSPSGNYTVYEMADIDKITQDRVELSITLEGQNANKLTIYINNDYKK